MVGRPKKSWSTKIGEKNERKIHSPPEWLKTEKLILLNIESELINQYKNYGSRSGKK